MFSSHGIPFFIVNGVVARAHAIPLFPVASFSATKSVLDDMTSPQKKCSENTSHNVLTLGMLGFVRICAVKQTKPKLPRVQKMFEADL